MHGHEAVVQQLLQEGADKIVTDNSGKMALMWAEKGKHEAVMGLLVKHQQQSRHRGKKMRDEFETDRPLIWTCNLLTGPLTRCKL
jgi:ankyrin repeat protein